MGTQKNILSAFVPDSALPRPSMGSMVITSCENIDASHATGLWLEEFAVPYLEFISRKYAVTVASIRGGKVPVDPHSDPKPEQAQAWAGAIHMLQKRSPSIPCTPPISRRSSCRVATAPCSIYRRMHAGCRGPR